MRSSQVLSILALTTSALALPQWGSWSGHWSGNWGNHGNDNNDDSAVATEVAVVTAYTTVTYGGNWGQPTPAPTPAPEASSGHNFGGDRSSHDAPAADSTPAPSSGSSGSTGTYMDTVNEWRGKLGLSSLSQASNLEANALKTCQDGNGEMVHELNPGTMGQVLAPGSADEFEKVFVGGWLCERPDMSGMGSICDSMSQGWAYNGETGHADILTSGSYSKIGCALANGIWGCDLA